jgi:hypothetical protein
MVQIKGQVVMSFHPKQLESAHLTRSAPSPHLGSLRHGGVPRLVLCSALKRGVEASAEGEGHQGHLFRGDFDRDWDDRFWYTWYS